MFRTLARALLPNPLDWMVKRCAGMPTLEDARRLVIEEIRKAKREGAKVLKVIHGYGSSGTGGKLCVGLRK